MARWSVLTVKQNQGTRGIREKNLQDLNTMQLGGELVRLEADCKGVRLLKFGLKVLHFRAFFVLRSISYPRSQEGLPLALILSRLSSTNRLKSAMRSPKMSLSNCSLSTSCIPSAIACSVSGCSATTFHVSIIDFVGLRK